MSLCPLNKLPFCAMLYAFFWLKSLIPLGLWYRATGVAFVSQLLFRSEVGIQRVLFRKWFSHIKMFVEVWVENREKGKYIYMEVEKDRQIDDMNMYLNH